MPKYQGVLAGARQMMLKYAAWKLNRQILKSSLLQGSTFDKRIVVSFQRRACAPGLCRENVFDLPRHL